MSYRDRPEVEETGPADVMVALRPGPEPAPSAKSTPFPFSLPVRDVNARFGGKVRTLRRERRWTQLQMAIILGINRSYLSEIERGRKSVSLGMLEVIALGFHMTIAELLRDV